MIFFIAATFDFSGTCAFLNGELLNVFYSDHKLSLINTVVLTAMIFRCLLPFLNFRFFFVSSVL